MTSSIRGKAVVAAMLGGMAGAADAAEILVVADIAASTTWTSNNTYNLQDQIYVLPGATLTIQAGTLVASTTDLGGSLAVCNGAKIIIKGTQAAPVIMTSKGDTFNAWREECNEWGNLTIMGDAYISENAIGTNTPDPDAANYGPMEGLVADFVGDTKVLYGGGDDDDDSGQITYLSLRYGGKVIGLNNELNGLSLGGIGRETDIHHVEIMNNVDDGIEIWGGTVNLRYFSIWNIGDDSFDVDQGWRGRGQFGLIVQGHSTDADSGSGVCDNVLETDGAEQSDYQPVTTTALYNLTLIGQPLGGDHGATFRDNARVQYRNCIFMDIGKEVVRFDNIDGDGGAGYGFGGTLSWADTWTTDHDAVPAHANDPAVGLPGWQGYTAQSDYLVAGGNSGKLAEIKDSVFFRNVNGAAYTQATARDVFNAGNDNDVIVSVLDADSPITSLVRGPAVVKGGRTILPVATLDPRPANEALVSNGTAPRDGFFTGADYRGAFAPGETWLAGWTASTAFGFTPATSPWTDMGNALEGVNGLPELVGFGPLTGGSATEVNLSNAKPAAIAGLFLAIGPVTPVPFKGGTLVPVPFFPILTLVTDAEGQIEIPFIWTPGVPAGVELFIQYGIADAAAVFGASLSNALRATAQ